MKRYLLIFFAIAMVFSSCKDDDSDESAAVGVKTAETSEFGTTYSFYVNPWGGQAWATISGQAGTVLPSVTSPKKAGWQFNGWNTKADGKGTTLPATFGSEPVSYYALWTEAPETALIGTKSAPDALYDIVFTDGSAMAYPDDVSTLTEDQIKAAVAMIISTTYNPSNGSNASGGQYQYKLAAGIAVTALQTWVHNSSLRNIGATSSESPDRKGSSDDKEEFVAYTENHILVSMMWAGYAFDPDRARAGLTMQPKQLSMHFGKQNYVDSAVFRSFSAYAPAFDWAIKYGRMVNMKSAYCSDWYLPSTSELALMLKDDAIKSRFDNLVARKYMSLPSRDNFITHLSSTVSFWSSSTDSSQTPNYGMYVGDYYNDDWKVAGHYGEKDYNENNNKSGAWLFDPYTGTEAKVYLPIHKQQNTDAEVAWWDEDEWDLDDGYFYQYIMYDKAFVVDISGEKSYGDKKVTHSVIAMRVF